MTSAVGEYNLSKAQRVEMSGNPHGMHSIEWHLNEKMCMNCFEKRHKRFCIIVQYLYILWVYIYLSK